MNNKNKIITCDNKILREISKPVKEINSETIKLIEKMFNAMYENNGIGLAAVQIGTPERIIIIDTTNPDLELKNVKPTKLVIINPEIIGESERTEIEEEGCLSVPGVRGKVKRKFFIELKGITPEEKEVQLRLYGLNARVAQHEIDHLNGILFIDKLEK